jgi:hypothetical protein
VFWDFVLSIDGGYFLQACAAEFIFAAKHISQQIQFAVRVPRIFILITENYYTYSLTQYYYVYPGTVLLLSTQLYCHLQ